MKTITIEVETKNKLQITLWEGPVSVSNWQGPTQVHYFTVKRGIIHCKNLVDTCQYDNNVSVRTPDGKIFLDLNDDADVLAFVLQYS